MTAQHSPQIRDLTLTALAAAILCVVSPFTLSIGPIPLSLCTLFLYLIPYLVGWKRATVATLVYILLGTAGVPVFSNFGAGLAKVAGPTGGYIVGYLPLVLISGLFVHLFPAKRWGQLAGMVLGTAVLYALGTAWFCIQSGKALAAALALCVFPFLLGDATKMAVSIAFGPMIRARMEKAGLLAD